MKNNKTLTERVRNLFIEKFEENNIDYTGLRIGLFAECGLECPLPTLLVFKNVPNDLYIEGDIKRLFFDIMDILNVNEKYDSIFDLLCIAVNTNLFDNEKTLEDF